MPFTPPRRVLIVRNDRIGDLMLTLPALEALRSALPQAHLSLLASSYAAPLMRGSQLVDECIEDDPTWTARDLAHQLKLRRFDTAIVINANTRNALSVWRAGIRRRVGWAYKPTSWIFSNHRVRLHRSRPPVHESEFAMEFVRALVPDVQRARQDPTLAVVESEQQRVATYIAQRVGADGPLFGVHPGNLKSAYNWPVDCYCELVIRLSKHGRVVVTGSQQETELVDQIVDAAATPRVLGVTNWSLGELAACIRQMDVLTISSTGPMHMAGVLGTPVVALFSAHPAHSPLKWRPLGNGHTILQARLNQDQDPCVTEDESEDHMRTISVNDVLRANLSDHRRVA